jgi:uncharacterized membrane protein
MKILKRPSALKTISVICTVVVFFLLFTLSCTKKVGLKTKAVVTQCDTISYAQDIAPIIAENCSINGCHVQPSPAGPGVMLDTYELLKAQAVDGSIKKRVIDEDPTPMPPGGDLTADEKKLIECWLNNGYLP